MKADSGASRTGPDLDQVAAAGGPQGHGSRAAGVGEGVGGQLADRDHQVTDAAWDRPGPAHAPGREVADASQVIAVYERFSSGWRSVQRPVAPDWGRALQRVVLRREAVVLRKTNGWCTVRFQSPRPVGSSSRRGAVTADLRI